MDKQTIIQLAIVVLDAGMEEVGHWSAMECARDLLVIADKQLALERKMAHAAKASPPEKEVADSCIPQQLYAAFERALSSISIELRKDDYIKILGDCSNASAKECSSHPECTGCQYDRTEDGLARVLLLCTPEQTLSRAQGEFQAFATCNTCKNNKICPTGVERLQRPVQPSWKHPVCQNCTDPKLATCSTDERLERRCPSGR